jgi:lipopolysaccharide/colanic/teichoic acid biosynthesis glycosyltransferase
MSTKTRSSRTLSDARPEVPPLPVRSRGRTEADPHVLRLPMAPSRRHWYVPCKTAVDFVAAALLLVPAAPVIALAALLVKLTSRGPAFYTQTRVGRNGRLFTIYKVRTMIDRCESLTGPRWSMPGDPRVTCIGHVLRVTHLDELPQLVNVLRGDMSLIGPRPERPEFVPELERVLPRYRERLAVLPGVTGLAQVHLAADTDLGSVRTKLAYDLYYLRHLSPGLDLRILLCTALYAVAVPFRWSRRLFGVPDAETVMQAVPISAGDGKGGRFRKSA